MKTRISIIILALAAVILEAVVFFVLIPDRIISDGARWLDFAVMTVITAIYALNVIVPFVDLSDRSQSGVASLGLRWATTGWYSALAVIFIVVNLICEQLYGQSCSLTLQATVQGALLLFFLMGAVSSRASMRKAREVFEAEKRTKQGKSDVKAALASLLSASERSGVLSPETVRKIRETVAEGRYITPSSSKEAKDADRAIIFDCDALAAALTDFTDNQSIIEERLHRLDSDIRLRRRL